MESFLCLLLCTAYKEGRKNFSLSFLTYILYQKFLRKSNFGWGGWVRTIGCRSQSPVPYHLATPQCGAPSRIRTDTGRILSPLSLPLDYRGILFSLDCIYIIAKILKKVNFRLHMYALNLRELLRHGIPRTIYLLVLYHVGAGRAHLYIKLLHETLHT